MHLVTTDMLSDRVPTTSPQLGIVPIVPDAYMANAHVTSDRMPSTSLDTVPIGPDTHMANTHVPSDRMPATSPQIDQGLAPMLVPATQAPIEHIHSGPMDLAEITPAALPPGNAHYVSHQVAPQQPPDFSGIMDTGADKHVTGTDAPTQAFSHYVPSLVKFCIANGDITSPSTTGITRIHIAGNGPTISEIHLFSGAKHSPFANLQQRNSKSGWTIQAPRSLSSLPPLHSPSCSAGHDRTHTTNTLAQGFGTLTSKYTPASYTP
jgi:hypothetical protein